MSAQALDVGVLIGGRYRLGAHLGDGGMGTVWAATHTITRRCVAMKFLKESLREKPDLRRRFLREASAASRLQHPNVVEVTDVFDVDDHFPVLVMELLEGETLSEKLRRDERLSVEETADLMLPVISAVGCAHSFGVVHRDLKPDNVFLSRVGEQCVVKVLDFGIAKLTVEQHLEADTRLVTGTGAMLGTPCYMSPEQATGEADVDHTADIWSLGVILYECLSGTRPIEGDNLAQIVVRLMGDGIMPLNRLAPELPVCLTQLVMQMLSRDRSKRPQSLQQVAAVLQSFGRVVPPEIGAPASRVRKESVPLGAPEGGSPGVSSVPSKTLHSATPLETSRTVAQFPPDRRRALVGWGLGIGLVSLGAFVFFTQSVGPPPEDRASTATVPAQLPSLPRAQTVPSESALSKGDAVTQGQPQEATTLDVVSSSTATATKKAPHGQKRAKPAPPLDEQPRKLTEDALFSGRK